MDHRPSATAVLVMRGLAAVAATPSLNEVVPEAQVALTYEILGRESWVSRLYLRLLRFRAFRTIVFGAQSLITPGILLHFALRKRFIEDAVRAALADGYRQVVVLGAGLDTLTLRLHREYPDVAFAEVDHPASQGAKRNLLPPSVGENVRFLPLDLAAGDMEAKLALFLAAEPRTVFVLEGLTMYLPESAVRALFATLVRLAPRARVVFTAMELTPEGVPDFRRTSGLVHWWLAKRREPFRWGIRPDDTPAFLAPLGLRLRDQAGVDRLREAYLPPEARHHPLAAGEWIYIAEAL
ncbi:MAG: class I SAM-dependent methyltransferase [Fimbriimonas sp.]